MDKKVNFTFTTSPFITTKKLKSKKTKTILTTMNYTFYRIKSKNPCITECYIGSTTNFIKRKACHKRRSSPTNNESTALIHQFIRSNGGWDAFDIEIIDTILFSQPDRLLHERRLIEFYGATLNTYTPFLTEEESHALDIARRRKYRETHKEDIKEYNSQYQSTHKEELKEKKRKYREAHKEEIKEKQRQYRETHKDEIKEYQRQRRLLKK